MINLEQFERRSSSNYYWNAQQVKKDLQKLFAYTYITRVSEDDTIAIGYLLMLWEVADIHHQKLSIKM